MKADNVRACAGYRVIGVDLNNAVTSVTYCGDIHRISGGA